MRRKPLIRKVAGAMITPLLAGVLYFPPFAAPAPVAHAATSTPTITLDPSRGPDDSSQAPTPISPYLYGANQIFKGDGGGIWDENTKAVKPAFATAFQNSGVNMIRYPGGTLGNTFRWKDAVGDLSIRKDEVTQSGAPATPYYGVDEALEFARSNNAQTLFVYNIANGSPADAAELVQYLNLPASSGTDGALLRDKYHPGRLPYGVKYFEIGNEFDLGGTQTYWTDGQPIDPNTEQPISKTKHELYALGGTVRFTQQPVVDYSDWRNGGSYLGVPITEYTDQSHGELYLKKFANYYPVLKSPYTTVYVDGQPWPIVSDLTQVGAINACSLNYDTGEIDFGDGVHGNIPPDKSTITISYETTQYGFKDYYAAMKNVDKSIRVYSSDFNNKNDFINVMGSTYSYDGIDEHLYTDNSPFPDGLDSLTYHDHLMTDLGYKSTALATTMNAIKAVVSPSQAANMDMIATEYGFGKYNSPTQHSYGTSLDAAIYSAGVIMGAMDAHSPVALKHLLNNLVAHPETGIQDGVFIMDQSTGTVVDTAVEKIDDMFSHFFGTESIQHAITGSPKRSYTDADGTAHSYDRLQFEASRDADGNVYLAVINKDPGVDDPSISDVTTKVNIDNFTASGTASVWQLNTTSAWNAAVAANDQTVPSVPYAVYNDFIHDPLVDIDKSVSFAASSSFSYTFPAHSITFIKIPGTVHTIDSGMALHYKLNEQSGTTAVDSSGNNRNGTLSSPDAPKWVAGGLDGGALNFAGHDADPNTNTLQKDNYVDTPFVLNPGTTPAFSATAWVKLDSVTTATRDILVQKGTIGRAWLYLSSSGHVTAYLAGQAISSTTTITDTNWHHVGLVYQNGHATMYVDGISSPSQDVTPDADSSDGMRIGEAKTGGQYFNGSIDDVRIYNWALDDADMAALVKEQQPKAIWKLDEASGTTAMDSSSTGAYNGTLVNPSPLPTACPSSGCANWAPNGGFYSGALQLIGKGGSVDTPFVLDPSATSFTATARVKLVQNNGGNQTILQQLVGGRGWMFLDSLGYLNTFINGSGVISTKAITDSNWHQVGLAVKRDNSISTNISYQVTLYIDGQPAGSEYLNKAPDSDSIDGMRIGGGKTNQYWNGNIDDVRIYNTAFSDDQMKDLYQG